MRHSFGLLETKDASFMRFRHLWKADNFQSVYGAGPKAEAIPTFEEWLVKKLVAAETDLQLTQSEIEIAIGYDPIHASWTDSTGSHGITTHMAAKDRDLIVNKILKAQEKKHG